MEFVWRRGCFVWEESQVNQLKALLVREPSQENEEGRWFWTNYSNGTYSIHFAYTVLQQLRNGCLEDKFLLQIWKQNV